MPRNTDTSAATNACSRIILTELEEMVAEGRTNESIAEHFGVTVWAVTKSKQRNNVRSYPKITDEELVHIIFNLHPTPGPDDGYRQLAARLRCATAPRCPLSCFLFSYNT